MATWKIEIQEKKGDQFRWKAALVANNGKRLEVGEFLEQKTARNYAEMELTQLTVLERAAPAGTGPMALPQPAGPHSQAA